MRLSLKLSVFTALGILLVLGCDGYLRVRREVRWFTDLNVETIARWLTFCPSRPRQHTTGRDRNARYSCYAT